MQALPFSNFSCLLLICQFFWFHISLNELVPKAYILLSIPSLLIHCENQISPANYLYIQCKFCYASLILKYRQYT